MQAEKAQVGKRYLSPRGVPLKVLGFKGDNVRILIESIDKEIDLRKTDEIRPYDETKISKDALLMMRANGKRGGKTPGAKPRADSLAAIIDPLLLAGGKTIKEVACEVAKKAGDAAKGKDLQANVRARMVSYRRQGHRIDKNGENHVKLVMKKG
jgi:hypothetical protein